MNGQTSPVDQCTCPVPHGQLNGLSSRPTFSEGSFVAPPLNHPKTFDEHLHEVGIRVLKSIQGFLAIIITISIFGASIFSSLISQLQEPPYSRFSLETIRVFMAISWLLFVVALGAATFTAVQLNATNAGEAGDAGAQAKADNLKTIGKTPRRVPRWKTRTALLTHFLTEILILGAFLFLSLVVVAYAEPVGWVAVGLTVFATLGVVGIWIHRIFEPKIAVSLFYI